MYGVISKKKYKYSKIFLKFQTLKGSKEKLISPAIGGYPVEP